MDFVTERHQITPVGGYGISPDRTVGVIKLNYYADPQTILVCLDGHYIPLVRYDRWKHCVHVPYEAFEYFRQMEEKVGGDKSLVTCEVDYFKSDPPTVDADKVNTADGITKALEEGDLVALKEIIDARSWYCGQCGERVPLKGFVVSGLIELRSDGRARCIATEDGELFPEGDKMVEEMGDFASRVGGENAISPSRFDIPTPRQTCACCREAITLRSLREKPAIFVSGTMRNEFYHASCWKWIKPIISGPRS